MNLMRRRRALMLVKPESQWRLQLQGNSNVQAVIDGHNISISFFPANGTNRQIQIVTKNEITLQAGDTIGIKYTQIGDTRPSRYCDLSFWSKTPTGSYTSRNMHQNFGFKEELNKILSYTATENIMGSTIVLQARNGNQTYSPPVQLHFELYINGKKVP